MTSVMLINGFLTEICVEIKEKLILNSGSVSAKNENYD